MITAEARRGGDVAEVPTPRWFCIKSRKVLKTNEANVERAPREKKSPQEFENTDLLERQGAPRERSG